MPSLLKPTRSMALTTLRRRRAIVLRGRRGEGKPSLASRRGEQEMSNDSDKQDPLTRACEHVGRFLCHFGRVERKIDEAVLKLLDLSEKLAPVVTAIDFAKKLKLVRLSADTQISDAAEKEKAHGTCSRVYKVNDERTLIAHSDFDAAPGGGVLSGHIFNTRGHVTASTAMRNY
jgi:hypothetical protein